MKTTMGSALIFGFAAVLGALIWILSPILTGEIEPWESFYLYSFALFLAGFLPASFSAQRSWLAAVGAWLGQMAASYLVLYPAEPFGPSMWPLGLLFVCLFSLLSVVGAGVGAVVHLTLRRFWFHTTPPNKSAHPTAGNAPV